MKSITYLIGNGRNDDGIKGVQLYTSSKHADTADKLINTYNVCLLSTMLSLKTKYLMRNIKVNFEII